MEKSNSLIYAYVLDRKGYGRKIKWNEISTWTPEQGILWLHLDYTKIKATSWLKKSSGLDNIIIRNLMIEESRPRCLTHANGILLFLRGVNLNPGHDPEDMVSVRVWIDENRIITTRKRNLLSLSDIENSILQGRGPKTTTAFLRALNDALLDRISDVLEKLDDQVDDFEKEIDGDQTDSLRPKISDARRQTILIRRYLAPQREALNRLYFDGIPLLTESDKVHFREANERMLRYIENLDATRERAIVIQEELSSKLSEKMNQRMYILSIVSIIFLPLTFITGLLGINVGGIPGASHQNAFWIVSSLLIGIIFLQFIYFSRKKWI